MPILYVAVNITLIALSQYTCPMGRFSDVGGRDLIATSG